MDLITLDTNSALGFSRGLLNLDGGIERCCLVLLHSPGEFEIVYLGSDFDLDELLDLAYQRDRTRLWEKERKVLFETIRAEIEARKIELPDGHLPADLIIDDQVLITLTHRQAKHFVDCPKCRELLRNKASASYTVADSEKILETSYLKVRIPV